MPPSFAVCALASFPCHGCISFFRQNEKSFLDRMGRKGFDTRSFMSSYSIFETR